VNLLLVILDSLRRDHVGCYGNDWIETPSLDAFSKESFIFESAFPESLPTIPVRRAIHTGKRTFPFKNYKPVKGDHVKVYGWQPIPEDQTTLAEILRHHGYRTAFITDTYHQFKPSMNFHRGFDEWRWLRGQESDAFNSNLAASVEKHLSSSGKGNKKLLRKYLANTAGRREEKDWFAPKVFSEGMRWLRENRSAEKFFLCVDSFDPHEPWDPPQPYVDLYDPEYEGKEVITPMYRDWREYLSEDELRHMRALYAGEVTMVDRWFGKLIGVLDELELKENTLIVVISDHGHQLGEHGFTGKVPRGLYPELMEIPLIIRTPQGEGQGKHVSPLVYNHDIFPTILSFLELVVPDPPDGIDLKGVMLGESSRTRPYVTSGFNNYSWITDEKYTLICRSDGAEKELYDRGKDRKQSKNIVAEEAEEAERLYSLLIHEAGGRLPDYSSLVRRKAENWYEK